MFLKPYRVKSQTKMKSSDKKRFRAMLTNRFSNLASVDADGGMLDRLLSVKEDIIMTKIYTFSGESAFVYSVGGDPLFFELDKQEGKGNHIFPTVYALWKCPELMTDRCMTTVPGAMSRIVNGADLMLPGVLVDVKNKGIKAFCGGKLKKGDPLCINVMNNKAAVAVGKAFQSSEDLYMQGMAGKAVNVIHFYGDNLWQSGSKDAVPEMGPVEDLDFLDENTTKEDDDQEATEAELVEEDCEKAMNDLELDSTTENVEQDLDRGDDNSTDRPSSSASGETFGHFVSPEAVMDDLLEAAFLQALKTSGKKLELPVLTSNFFRLFMIPACPEGESLNVKKSSYKKLSKFLEKMKDEKIIVIREQKKGIETISEINFTHEKLKNFVPHKVGAAVDVPPLAKGSSYSPPTIQEMRFVSGQTVNFFREFGLAKGDGLTSAEVKELIREYVKKNQLQHSSDPTIVNLDPVLAEAVLVKGENLVVTFPWDKLASRVTGKMTQGYSIKYADKAEPTFHKGKLEPIIMSVATRSGNKKVTLIHNLDLYGISLAEFSHKCQVGVAASSSVYEAPNKKRSNGQPVMELFVQGNQIAFASKLLLEDYRLPRKSIRGMELAVKEKKNAK